MARTITSRKGKRPLRITNQFKDGGNFWSGFKDTFTGGVPLKDIFSGTNGEAIGSSLAEGLGNLSGTIGKGVSGLFSHGLSSGVGNAVTNATGAVSSLVSKVNPAAGLVIGGVGGAIGGGINALFGSKLNEENIAEIENNIKGLRSSQFSGNFDDITSQLAKQQGPMNFSKNFIGKEGVFSNAATNKYNYLRGQENSANVAMTANSANAASNAEKQIEFNAMANYQAFGGPLYPYAYSPAGLYSIGDALPYGYMQDRLDLAQQKLNAEGADTDLSNVFASGGGIHINPKNKGKLTATAKRTGKSFSELAHSKNPLTRKRAIFALNARKWHHGKKHALGGNLYDEGGDEKTDNTDVGLKDVVMSYLKEKASPYIDALTGVTPIRIGEPPIDIDFDTAIKLFGYSSVFPSPIERPNTSRLGKIGTPATNIANERRRRAMKQLLELNRLESNKHALGGDLQSNGADWDLGYFTIGNGGTHEENPNEGVQLGMDNQGVPNLAEQGEVVHNNYVYSETKLQVDEEASELFNLPKSYIGLSYAEAAIKVAKDLEERPNDPISRRGYETTMQRLQQAQEYTRQKLQADRTKEMINNMSPEELQGLMAMANQGMQQQAQDQAMQEQAAQEQMMVQQGINPNALGAEALYGACGGRLGRRYDGWGEFMNFLQKYDPQSYNLLDSYLLKDGNGKYMIDQDSNYMFDPNKDIPASNLDYYIQNWWNNRGNLYTGKRNDLPNSIRNIIGDSNPIYDKEDNPYNFKGSPLEYLRFAGIIPQLLINAPLAFSKANYENPDRIEAAAYNTGYAPIRYEPLGNYLQYTPEDISLPLAANAQAAAREQAMLRNASNGNRGALAAYLANSNYNAQLANSQLFRDAVKQNQEEKEKVTRFNRETDQTNADNALKAAMQNQDARMKGSAQTLNALITAANMRQNIADTKTQARSDFANGLAAYFAGIGEDYFNRNTVQGMRSLDYYRGNRGSSEYKGLNPDYNIWWPYSNYSSKNLIPSTKEQAEQLIQDALDPFDYRNKASYGGKINAKKRKVRRRKYA